jgi:2-phosphosulfolactate phosphatase
MNIKRTSLLSGAEAARGCTVIIDVFRAFTCAGVILHLGAEELRLERDAETCLRLKAAQAYLAVGEIDGVTVEGFDLGNSPARIAAAGRDKFAGRGVALRTSAGVAGVFAARNAASRIWAGSFTTARALAQVIRRENPEDVTLVAMGWNGVDRMPEDEHCARYLHSLLDPAVEYDHAAALVEILGHESAQKFFRGDKPHFPPEDITWCLHRDLFDFALRVEDSGGVLRVVKSA